MFTINIVFVRNHMTGKKKIHVFSKYRNMRLQHELNKTELFFLIDIKKPSIYLFHIFLEVS